MALRYVFLIVNKTKINTDVIPLSVSDVASLNSIASHKNYLHRAKSVSNINILPKLYTSSRGLF